MTKPYDGTKKPMQQRKPIRVVILILTGTMLIVLQIDSMSRTLRRWAPRIQGGITGFALGYLYSRRQIKVHEKQETKR